MAPYPYKTKLPACVLRDLQDVSPMPVYSPRTPQSCDSGHRIRGLSASGVVIIPMPCKTCRSTFSKYSCSTMAKGSSSPSFSEIPVIDLSQADDASSLPGLLKDLRVALTDIGFLYVSNHGVHTKTVEGLVEVLPQLFSLPESAKRGIALENSPHFLGYSGTGTENTAGQADQREQVEFATELPSTWVSGEPLSERLRGPNQASESFSSTP